MAAETVRVKGLRELTRALNRVNKDVNRELKGELRKAAQLVATEARAVAEFQGLRDTGRLIGSIRPSVSMRGAYVNVSANRAGFSYPSVYEFGGRDVQLSKAGFSPITNRSAIGTRLRSGGLGALGTHGQYGPRAFLGPALELKRDEVLASVERMLDTVGRQNGF